MVTCPCQSGKDPTKHNKNAITILSDSMVPMAMDMDGTQLPCSPSELLSTDAALKTLKDVDDHDKATEEQVHWYKIQKSYTCPLYKVFYISHSSRLHVSIKGNFVASQGSFHTGNLFPHAGEKEWHRSC